ncbi:hypothetical protein JCM10213_002947 [Rhodosporidiobolus nylandii]
MGTLASPAASASAHGSFSGIALWLTPASSAVETDLASLISSLSVAHSTPAFSPHVTLISGIPSDTSIPAILSQLATAVSAWRASHQPPLHLGLGALGSHASQGLFFQYLFSKILPTPELLALRQAARASFFPARKAEEDDYFPHLSLAYGEDSEKDGRSVEAIMRELMEKGEVKQVGGEKWSVQGVDGLGVTEITVVRCDGKAEQWQTLGSVPL